MKRLLLLLLVAMFSCDCANPKPVSKIVKDVVRRIPVKKIITHVTLTTYNAVVAQCDDSPTITSDGTKISHRRLKNGTQRIVAISRDLLWLFPMGSKILIEGHGVYTIHDVMNKRFNHCMDILQHISKKNFKEEKVKVTLLEKKV